MHSFENEEKKIRTARTNLNSISESFCLVRWKHATINLATGASKSCCHHHYKDISLDNPDFELHDNEKEISIRQEMLEGQKTKDCSQCWSIEDQGHASDRINWSAKSWMAPFFNDVSKNISAKASTPSWLELNFSSLCNLKCIYCSPIFSTQWYKEIKDKGTYNLNLAKEHNEIESLNHVEFEDSYENKPLMEKFWPWFEKVLPDLRLLKITGGEPLLSENTFKMMDRILENPPPELILGFNSNFSIGPKNWQRFLEKIKIFEKRNIIKGIQVFPSIDTFGQRAEYIRTGLDFELFKKNVEDFLQVSESGICFICTLNNLALGGLLDFWKFVLELKKNYFKPHREILISTELLHSPQWLSLNILPDEMITYFDDVIAFVEDNIDESGKGFNRVELEGLKKAQSFFMSRPKDIELQRANLSRYLTQIDERRGLDRFQTFPELKSFFEDIQTIHIPEPEPIQKPVESP